MRQVLESRPEVRVRRSEVHVVCRLFLRMRRLTETRGNFRKSPATLDTLGSGRRGDSLARLRTEARAAVGTGGMRCSSRKGGEVRKLAGCYVVPRKRATWERRKWERRPR